MKQFLFLVALVLMGYTAKSQTCGTCTVNITDFDNGSYTITTGQTFCVDSTGNFEGSLTLNGGTLCNKGIFKAQGFVYQSGIITNKGTMSVSNGLNLNSSHTFDNTVTAVLNLKNNLSVTGGNFTNAGIINIQQNIIHSSGSFSNSGIMNCEQVTGSATINNTGVINSN
jgi:hypothetical protein